MISSVRCVNHDRLKVNYLSTVEERDFDQVAQIIYYHLVLSSGKPTNMHIQRSQPLRNEFCRSGVHLDNMHLQNIPSTVDIVTSGNNLSSVS